MGNISQQQQKWREIYRILNDSQRYFQEEIWKQYNEKTLNTFSVITDINEDRVWISDKINQILGEEDEGILNGQDEGILNGKQFGFQDSVNRGIGCFVGLGVCDALASTSQFMQFSKSRVDLIGTDFKTIKQQIKQKKLPLAEDKIGLWTNDTGMTLCLADSLYIRSEYKQKHFLYMLLMWKQHGLNNGGRNKTYGVTENVTTAIEEFCKERVCDDEKFGETKINDELKWMKNNGNQGIVRAAAVVLFFVDSEKQILEISENQCKITNDGIESIDCCKLLALILVRLIKRPISTKWRSVIDEACTMFSRLPRICGSVVCLSLSKVENFSLYQSQLKSYGQIFRNQNKSLEDRNWNWKSQNFTYSRHRTLNQPKSIGSYCMDALAMALHIVWSSNSFQQIAIRNANMGGNCCTVGAIAGCLGGAIYGIDEYMMKIYQQMPDFKDKKYELLIKAYKLLTHPPV